MSTRVILDAHVAPDALETIKAGLPKLLEDTRGFEGCEELRVNVNQDDPCHLLFLGRWTSRAHYERYLERGRQEGAVDEFTSMLTQPLSIRYFDDLGH